MTIGRVYGKVHIARRLSGLARRTRRIPIRVTADPSRNPAPGQAKPAGEHRPARHADSGAAASAARERMREVLSRSRGRGVSVTMIVNVLASERLSVRRSTVRRWLAEDIKRGMAERVTPGVYRTRRAR